MASRNTLEIEDEAKCRNKSRASVTCSFRLWAVEQ